MESWKKEGKEGGAIRNGREEEKIRNRRKELYVYVEKEELGNVEKTKQWREEGRWKGGAKLGRRNAKMPLMWKTTLVSYVIKFYG